VVKPIQITVSDRCSIDLYPCKVNPVYTEEGRPQSIQGKAIAGSTQKRRFPSYPRLGKDATVLSTRLLEVWNDLTGHVQDHTCTTGIKPGEASQES
jgi:hypothetical protein